MTILQWLYVAAGVYIGALVLYALGWLVYLHPGRAAFVGKVALVSIPMIALMAGVRALWRSITGADWSGIGQSILDWMGWVTANIVIVSGIGLAWLVVALATRVSIDEWVAAQRQRILTWRERAEDKPLLDIGPMDVAADIRDASRAHLADLVHAVNEWKRDNPGSVLGPDDDTLEIMTIPDTVVEMFSGGGESK